MQISEWIELIKLLHVEVFDTIVASLRDRYQENDRNSSPVLIIVNTLLVSHTRFHNSQPNEYIHTSSSACAAGQNCLPETAVPASVFSCILSKASCPNGGLRTEHQVWFCFEKVANPSLFWAMIKVGNAFVVSIGVFHYFPVGWVVPNMPSLLTGVCLCAAK